MIKISNDWKEIWILTGICTIISIIAFIGNDYTFSGICFGFAIIFPINKIIYSKS